MGGEGGVTEAVIARREAEQRRLLGKHAGRTKENGGERKAGNIA